MGNLASRNERGYGREHQHERKRWERILKTQGPIECVRGDCGGTLIHHDDQWDLGHTDDRTAWTGPECIPCNRSAGGRNGAKVTNTKRQTIVREW